MACVRIGISNTSAWGFYMTIHTCIEKVAEKMLANKVIDVDMSFTRISHPEYHFAFMNSDPGKLARRMVYGGEGISVLPKRIQMAII